MNFSIFAEQIAVYDYLPVNRSGIWLHFVSYLDSIEQNLMALVLTKERLNEFIKSGEVREQ